MSRPTTSCTTSTVAVTPPARLHRVTTIGLMCALCAACGVPSKVQTTGTPAQSLASSSNTPIPAVSTATNLERDADMGDVKSQMTLARSLLAGDGVPKSSTKACKWFERAGEGGQSRE